MPTFSANYTEPGIYVDIKDVSSPAIAPGQTVIAFIGYGKLTKRFSESLTRDAAGSQDWTDTLSKDAVSVTSQIIDEFGNVYYKNEDYILSIEDGNSVIDWGLGDAQDTGEAPSGGTEYEVIYEVFKTQEDDDFEPQMIQSEDHAYDVFGDPLETNDSDNKQTLPLGLKIAFGNGSAPAMAVQIDENDSDPIKTAIDKLEKEYVNIVVPCLPISSDENNSVVSDLYSHVRDMSSLLERKYRIALLGLSTDVDNPDDFASTVSEYENLASVDSDRMGIIGGSKTGVNIDGEENIVGSWTLASAIAGILGNPNFDVAEPISGKILTGIDKIYDIWDRKQKNQIASKGITIVEEDGIVNRVRHFLSTDMTTPISQELKTKIVADYIARITIDTLKATFINTRNVGQETISNIEAVQRLLLQAQQDNDILRSPEGFRNINAKQNETEPRQIDINYEILPVLEVNWIYINMGITF